MNLGATLLLETSLLLNFQHTPLLYCPRPEDSPADPTSVSFLNHLGLLASLESLGFTDVQCKSVVPGDYRSWEDFIAEQGPYLSLDAPAIGRGTYTAQLGHPDGDRARYWYGLHDTNAVTDFRPVNKAQGMKVAKIINGVRASAPVQTGLVRGLDPERRRHTYAVGSPPPGKLVGELGALLAEERPGLVALRRMSNGYLRTDAYVPEPSHAGVRGVGRYVLAPLAWRGPWQAGARMRACGRRSLEAARALVSPKITARLATPGRAAVDTLGFLLPDEGEDRVPLYSALHPVNGDQLLTRSAWEAKDMGYGDAVLLGYMRRLALVTGHLEMRRLPVPWASRFGLRTRPG
jgi:hypothetical protein